MGKFTDFSSDVYRGIADDTVRAYKSAFSDMGITIYLNRPEEFCTGSDIRERTDAGVLGIVDDNALLDQVLSDSCTED